MQSFVEVMFFDAEYSGMKGGGNLPSAVFAELNRRWPQFSPQSGLKGFNVRVLVGCDLQKEIFDFLKSHGRVPVWSCTRTNLAADEFRLRGVLEFEAQDFERAKYMRMFFKKDMANRGGYADAQWHLWVLAGGIYSKVAMGADPDGGLPLVDAKMHDRMLAQEFKDVYFRPVEIRGESPRAKQLWQVWSDRVLPAMLPVVNDADDVPYDPATGTVRPFHSFFNPCPMRFRQGQVESMGEFDFALTKESWDAGARYPMMIVSKRVYEWCAAQGVADGWIPLIEE